MAEKVLILGESGTGKSAGMRNFSAAEICVISCAGKRLPFKNDFEVINPDFDNLTRDVLEAMTKAANDGRKVLVVDDAQYIMSFQYMRRIKEAGWDKWNDIQGDFFQVLHWADELPNDMIVYFLSHIQRDDAGREKIKTMGKMLDEKITIEGLFTTVLKTAVADGQYMFLTQNSGNDTVKSPIGMFDSYAIDNDLKYVDTKIRNYYGIGGAAASDAEIAELDKVAAKPDVQKPDADGRKRRKRKEHAERVGDGKDEEEKPEEASAEEEAKEAVAAGNIADAAEQPKRRRKRRADSGNIPADAAQVVADTIDIYAGEIPFD